MATQTIEIPGFPGRTTTFSLYPASGGAAVDSDVATTETIPSRFRGTVSGRSGSFIIVAKSNGTIYDNDVIDLEDTANIFYGRSEAAAQSHTSELSGSRTVSITVNDGTNSIEGALVRLTKGAETGVKLTDVNGQVSFSVDDGTWKISITASGYDLFSPVDLVVDGDETASYSLSPQTITPATGDFTTAYTTVLNNDSPVPDVDVVFEMIEKPKKAGRLFRESTETATSNASGVVQIALARGARYKASIGESCEEFSIPDSAGDTFKIEDLLI